MRFPMPFLKYRGLYLRWVWGTKSKNFFLFNPQRLIFLIAIFSWSLIPVVYKTKIKRVSGHTNFFKLRSKNGIFGIYAIIVQIHLRIPLKPRVIKIIGQLF
jgi:hypothetical protein